MIYDLVVWILDQNNDAKKWHAMTSERLKQRVLPQIENSSALWSPHSATPCLLDKKIKILAVLLILSTGSMWWFSQTTVSPSLKSPAEIADLEEGSFISAHCDMEGYNMTFGEFMAQVNEITPADRGYFCKGIRSRDCGCIEPTRAQPGFSKKWFRAFDWLKEHAAGAPTPLQVAFLGDSIFDRLNGRLALQEDESMADVYEVFKELFTTDGGGQINGVSLGLAGDLSQGLLYRIQNGLIQDIHPNIFWQLIGTNDIGLAGCNAQAIVAANIAIVEQVLQLRPNSTVVINSILPRDLEMYWKYLKEVNHRLECYAAMTERVEFFNATRYFLSRNGSSLMHLPDGIHPNVDGYRFWGKGIVKKVSELVER